MKYLSIFGLQSCISYYHVLMCTCKTVWQICTCVLKFILWDVVQVLTFFLYLHGILHGDNILYCIQNDDNILYCIQNDLCTNWVIRSKSRQQQDSCYWCNLGLMKVICFATASLQYHPGGAGHWCKYSNLNSQLLDYW